MPKIHYPSARDAGTIASFQGRRRNGKEAVEDNETDQGLPNPGTFDNKPEDIKTALDKAKRMYGINFGRIKRVRRVNLADLVMQEDEFLETGGVVGYMDRGRCLLKKRNLNAALEYLNFAIANGCKDLSNFVSEPSELLLARQFRAEALLRDSQYSKALEEANNIIMEKYGHLEALYIKAESHYHLCQFEFALVSYYKGLRLRSGVYVEEFQDGIHKTEKVLLNSLIVLEDKRCRKFLGKIAGNSSSSKSKTREQREFEIIVRKAFNDTTNDCSYSKKERDLKPPEEELTPQHDTRPKIKFGIVSQIAMTKGKLSRENPKNMKSEIGNSRSKLAPYQDANMRRLKNDARFLDLLRGNVVHNLCQRVRAQTLEKPSRLKLFQILDNRKIMRHQASKYESNLMKIAEETLGYIDERKVFWKAQREEIKRDCQIRKKKTKQLKYL